MNIRYLKARAINNFKQNKSASQAAILTGFITVVLINLLRVRADAEDRWIFILAKYLVEGPLLLGIAMVFLNISRGGHPGTSDVLDGFKLWSKSVWLSLLMTGYIILYTLLLIVPGIQAAISYSMAYFIMADNPEFSAQNALTASRNLMSGHRNELLLLCLSFIGWLLASIVTFGLSFVLYAGPYIYATIAEFYESLLEQGDY